MAAYFSYDEDADLIAIRLSEPHGRVSGQEIDEHRVLEHDETNAVVGATFLFVSEGIDLSGLPKSDDFRAALAAVGKLPFIKDSGLLRTA